MIKAVVVGACGKMGQEIIKGISKTDDIQLVGACDVQNVGKEIGELTGLKPLGVQVNDDLLSIIETAQPDVIIDFTHKEAAKKNITLALKQGIAVVVGTTGFSKEEMSEIDSLAQASSTGAFLAPNFSLGAVIMMKWARDAARYFSQAEIIEYHNDKKVDSPSGTAIATACAMRYTNSPICETVQMDNCSRGGQFYGVNIHSVRLKSLVAHQEVLFAGIGELLTIRHDSFSRESFIPGILLAVRKVKCLRGLKIGLENILD
ncbi:MAG: 4-hydroxy-tetrahydrodipicolinate reductase [Bacillota bacterium]|uniref:4-hydroxy-tetrahydrodipicolinate reductase n=2 Tax=Thermanaerosceptrum fracticalcis TaxID=1712410 RepID=A0A7G6E899_THEFR|nr:4-hydroxy-tetrahydrodipicolinate reductase [Thermanaerosceptrum fracticalcis]